MAASEDEDSCDDCDGVDGGGIAEVGADGVVGSDELRIRDGETAAGGDSATGVERADAFS